MQIEHSLWTVDSDKIPAGNLNAMIARGVKHYLNNEVASKVAAWANAEGQDSSTGAAGYIVTEDEKLAKRKAFTAAAIETLYTGEVGQGQRGTPVDPLEAKMESLAKTDVLTILKAQGVKAPKGEEVITFASGATRTMEQMIDNRLAKFSQTKDAIGGNYELVAKKFLAEKVKKVATAKASVKAADISDLL